MTDLTENALRLTTGDAHGMVLAFEEGLSFWGGVDPQTSRVMDAHHPAQGAELAGKFLMMPTSRGSCSGSGVLLELALAGRAPAALVFREPEETLTLGALVAERLFGRPIPVLRVSESAWFALASEAEAHIEGASLTAGALRLKLESPDASRPTLSASDRAMLNGAEGEAAALAMGIVVGMAAAQGAPALRDVTRGHVDGCILAHSANLTFAERLADMGARVCVPTTINAISVDRENWCKMGVEESFGTRASRLADAYVAMGARPTFTCAPYQLDGAPEPGECIGWSESNAVIYANSVLGARTAKHPDYLDICIAVTGRAPGGGVYGDEGRTARRVIELHVSEDHDETLWPLAGWCAGRAAPDRIPLLRGLEAISAGPDDLRALCAAFGTTAGAPMLHVAGHTPEADRPPAQDADACSIGAAHLRAAWEELNRGATDIDLVAIGSPHASLSEVRRLAELMEGRRCAQGTALIVTLGRATLGRARSDGTAQALERAGARLVPDLCWCSITEPVLPPGTRAPMTNSGKYAHYAHGLTGLHARLGSLADCAEAAVTGRAPDGPPGWLA